MENVGKIVQIIGAVVDAQFAREGIPAIYSALEIQLANGEKLVLEVQQHIGEGVVRTVAMSATDRLRRGMDVIDTGEAIAVPVGEGVLGPF
jgi:F-type H+-transporting ATPase subunit beta